MVWSGKCLNILQAAWQNIWSYFLTLYTKLGYSQQRAYAQKGGVNLSENFRGISSTSMFSTIFTGVLNKRLQRWASDIVLIQKNKQVFEKGMPP